MNVIIKTCLCFFSFSIINAQTIYKEYASEKFAVFKHIALNLLKQEKTTKGCIYAKQLQAAWNENYLLKLPSP